MPWTPQVLRSAIKYWLSDISHFSRLVLGRPLRTYQLEPARAILRSILHGRGHTFAVMMSRQSGKNELAAQLEAYLLNLYQPRFVELGVPSVWLGAGLALASGVSIVGARYAYLIEKHLGARFSLVLVSGLPGVLYLLFALATVPHITVAVFCLLYGSMSLRDPVFSAHLNRHIESANRATVLSFISMFSGIYVALVGLVIGLIADLSLAYAFGFMGAVVLLGTVILRPSEL